MIKNLTFFFSILVIGCTVENKKPDQTIDKNSDLELNETIALRLSKLPIKCLQQEYPNKLGQVLNSDDELKSPGQLHPAFYGCFDWHSSVHGNWLLVKLLKEFPQLENQEEIRKILNEQLTVQNIATELEFFKTKFNESFERTYGWAWLLKLQLELDEWDDKDAKKWSEALQQLSNFIVEKYIVYLPKLVYPIRTGEHINTAFGLSFAYDYANHINNLTFISLIKQRSKDFFLKDKKYPLNYEPSGYDFISPALAEADLMRRILSKKEFIIWMDSFLPEIKNPQFKLQVGKVSDRTDGKLVHLDGLNFSRAWCLYGIANVDPKYKHLKIVADQHLSHSLHSIVDGDYMGEHWLASFALYALFERK